MDRKHDILVLVWPVEFLLLPVSEEEAADRFRMFMYDQLRNLISVFPLCFTLLLKISSNSREIQVPYFHFYSRK